MGKQSARIYYGGKDHKEIFCGNKYHDSMHIGNDIVWEKVKSPSESFIFKIKKGSGENLNFSFKASGDFDIAWGNIYGGNIVEHYSLSELTTISCFYSVGDPYTVTISGNLTNISLTKDGSGYYVTEVLTKFPESMKNVTSLANLFYGQTELAVIASDLLSNCNNVVSFEYAFSQTAIKEIPAGFFGNNVNAENFSYCFNGCTLLKSIPSGLFKNFTRVTTFELCFAGCTSLAEIPEDIFGNCISVKTYKMCFNKCSSILSVPENMFDGSPNVLDFHACFYRCSKITTNLPKLWTRTNFPDSSYYSYCFYGCTSAANYASIPADWK